MLDKTFANSLAVKKKILLIALLSEENFANSLAAEENFANSKK